MAIAFPLTEGVLREAFVDLQSHSSCLTDFTCKWKDLEVHLSLTADLIEKRFSELKSKETTSAPEELEKGLKEQDTVEARPELKSLCASMDIKGLRNFMEENRKDIGTIIGELGPALRLAPDPVELVLNSLDGFFSSKGEKGATVLSIRKTSVNLLEGLLRLAPEVKPSSRECSPGGNGVEAEN
ncbi:hypothetical protein HPP92_006093 [Vanilla planifolia]|uniref:FRIGIDA-like protein n=1 Tax=Vanilla planifolia TaxID=51239 RepID=A0A835RI22_VANPL|nr:hypothetical protein HPP92_006093 [Vanilla planifolia]